MKLNATFQKGEQRADTSGRSAFCAATLQLKTKKKALNPKIINGYTSLMNADEACANPSPTDISLSNASRTAAFSTDATRTIVMILGLTNPVPKVIVFTALDLVTWVLSEITLTLIRTTL